ncbi:MAG: flagellar hook assembly protein FlgD, partial [Eubacteriales bacterium]
MMKKIFRRKLWMQVIAVVLAMALNLGALDGIINGVLRGAGNIGLTDPGTKFDSTPPAYADPGDGSFNKSPFDPNHDETSTLNFTFDYNHDVKIELFYENAFVKTLDDRASYQGKYINEEDEKTRETPRHIINHYTWNGKDGNGEPMDDGNYTVKLTPLDEWSEYPLEAGVRIHQYPHIPTHDVFIDYNTGQITIKGEADKNNKIIIYINGVETATTMSDSTKTWQWSTYLDEGKIYTISAEAENKWGTRSKGRSN